MKKAVFLFDYTGIMAKDWAEGGWTCYCFDGQHPEGESEGVHPNIINVGMWFSNQPDNDDVEKIIEITGDDVTFVFGFPECTDLAVSGAGWFKKKRLANPAFQTEAMQLVQLTRDLGESLACPWAFENPISVISSLWRKPDHMFHPWEYGAYLPEGDVHPTYPEYIKPRDAYPKKTCIWSGNGFNMPAKNSVEIVAGYSDQHKKLGGKSLKTKNIRSATPRGFAKGVYLANSKWNNSMLERMRMIREIREAAHAVVRAC